MSNNDYNAKKFFIKDINFEVVIICLPDNEINDKLTLLTRFGGNITVAMFEDFVIGNFIVNISQLIHHLQNNNNDNDNDNINLKKILVEKIYECNSNLSPEKLIINKNQVVKIKNDDSDDEMSIVLIDNKYWNIKRESISSKNINTKDKKNEKIDINDIKYDIKQVWWNRVKKYINIKQFSDDDIDNILNDRYFNSRAVFNNFVVGISLEDMDYIYGLIESDDVPRRVPEQVLIGELAELCKKINPNLSFDNANKTESDEDYNYNKVKRKQSSMAGHSKEPEVISKYRFKHVDKNTLLKLYDNIKVSVIGQNEAIGALVDSIQRASIGLRDPNRPIGSFLFTGRTGVGKTLTSKSLADELISEKNNIVIIDCSEYSADHEYSKLIGSGPGYVGFEQGGYLTNAVRKNPFSVVLFDEIEKASSKVHELMLQILDEGRLTDGRGITVSFKESIIIMTSNLGVKEIDSIENTVGFGNVAIVNEKNKNEAIKKALKSKFKPEFLNRIDNTINFKDLTKKDYLKISEIELYKLNNYLKNNNTNYKNLIIDFDSNVKDFIYKNGVDKKFGARPIKRYIEKNIATPIARKILNESIDENSIINVSVNRNKVNFTVLPNNDLFSQEEEALSYINN